MTRATFLQQLKEMGFQPINHPKQAHVVVFPYTVKVGKFMGKQLTIGLQVTDMTPPPGPHITPRLLPIHPGNDIPHPNGGVHASPDLGAEWQYWSRPFKGWNKTDRSARTYLAHLNTLFDSQ